MLKTREWRGIPFITGALTDILLSLEDCLDRRVPAFIRVLDAESLTHRLRQDAKLQRESAALLNGRLSASLISHFSASAIQSVDRDFLMYVLLNLAGDNGERVLVLTDYANGALGGLKKRRGMSSERIASVVSYSASSGVRDLVKAVYQTNATIVLSDISDTNDFELYEKTAWESGRPLLWIQLPSNASFTLSVNAGHEDTATEARSIALRPTKWKARVNLAYHILQTQLKLG